MPSGVLFTLRSLIPYYHGFHDSSAFRHAGNNHCHGDESDDRHGELWRETFAGVRTPGQCCLDVPPFAASLRRRHFTSMCGAQNCQKYEKSRD